MIIKQTTRTGTRVLFTEGWNRSKDISEEKLPKREQTGSSPRREKNSLRFDDDNPLVIEDQELAAMFYKKQNCASNSQNSLYIVNGKRFIGTHPIPNVQEDDEEMDDDTL